MLGVDGAVHLQHVHQPPPQRMGERGEDLQLGDRTGLLQAHAPIMKPQEPLRKSCCIYDRAVGPGYRRSGDDHLHGTRRPGRHRVHRDELRGQRVSRGGSERYPDQGCPAQRRRHRRGHRRASGQRRRGGAAGRGRVGPDVPGTHEVGVSVHTGRHAYRVGNREVFWSTTIPGRSRCRRRICTGRSTGSGRSSRHCGIW